MELPRLHELRVDSANQELLHDLDQVKATIDAARPLDSAVVSRVRNELLGDQVHNSNAIEGNTLSLRETRTVLETGQLVDVGRPRDYQEAINLGKAIDAVQSTLQEPRFAEQSFFSEVHRVLFTDLRTDIAGRYRDARILLTGAKHQPPKDFRRLLDRMFELLVSTEGIHPVVTAAWTHWAIARIHPFKDGNGRMARLWQDYILLAHNYTPAVIPESRQKEYCSALELADDGDFSAVLQLVTQSATATSQMYVNAIRAADEAGSWADALIGETEQLADERHRLEYSRWQSRVLELRDAFVRCLTLLNRKSSALEFDLHDFPIVDMATWESLKSEAHAPQTWCFRIDARSDTGRFLYVFFVGRHFRSAEDDAIKLAGKHVTLLVSEQKHNESAVRLADDNNPISLREILVVNNELIRKRWDSQTRTMTYDRNLTALTIAQDFLAEIVRHRLV